MGGVVDMLSTLGIQMSKNNDMLCKDHGHRRNSPSTYDRDSYM